MAEFNDAQRAKIQQLIEMAIGNVDERFGAFLAQGAMQVTDLEAFATKANLELHLNADCVTALVERNNTS